MEDGVGDVDVGKENRVRQKTKTLSGLSCGPRKGFEVRLHDGGSRMIDRGFSSGDP